MKVQAHNTFPELRRRYDSLDDLGRVINRTRVTVFRKLLNESFTQREKELISNDLISRGIETGVKETIEKYFGG